MVIHHVMSSSVIFRRPLLEVHTSISTRMRAWAGEVRQSVSAKHLITDQQEIVIECRWHSCNAPQVSEGGKSNFLQISCSLQKSIPITCK